MKQCDMPHCRGSVDIIYLGKNLCWDHWEKKCQEGKP